MEDKVKALFGFNIDDEVIYRRNDIEIEGNIKYFGVGDDNSLWVTVEWETIMGAVSEFQARLEYFEEA